MEPGAHVAAYAERYGRFVDALRARGYVETERSEGDTGVPIVVMERTATPTA